MKQLKNVAGERDREVLESQKAVEEEGVAALADESEVEEKQSA
jgi:hypothetical protein